MKTKLFRNRIPKPPPWDDDNIITKDDYFKIIKSCAESDITKAAKGFWSKRPASERNELKKSKRNKGLKQVGFTMDRKQYEAVLEAGGSDSFSTIARDAMNLYIASKQVPW